MKQDITPGAAKIEFAGKTYSLDVMVGTENEHAVDISEFRKQSGCICLDPGFGNTGSCTSAITFLDGEIGVIRHRGYELTDLASQCSFMEVAYLLMIGELPTPSRYQQLFGLVKENNFLGPMMQNFLNNYPVNAHPMATLASSVLALGGFYPDLGQEVFFGLDMDVVRLLAKTPAIAAHNYRRKRGLGYIPPNNRLGYAENFLYCMFGEELEPERRKIMGDALEKLLIIHADHEQNCSTSTVRMISSSDANVYAAIGGGIGALWGPLHGGANEAVINMLENIAMHESDLGDVIRRAKDKNDPFRLMGFGHRVYKTYDPRARIAKKVVDDLLEKLGIEEPLVDIAMALEKVALEDDYFVSRNLYPNVDFYTGTAYKAMGIPKEMFTVLFAMGRMAGWLAHLIEFRRDPERRISRPRQIYVGEAARAFKAMDAPLIPATMKAFRGLGLCLMLAARAETPLALSPSGHAWYAPLPVVSPPGRPVRTPLPWDVWQQSADVPEGLLLLAGRDVRWPFSLYLAKDERSPVSLRPLDMPEAAGERAGKSEAFAVDPAGMPIHRLSLEFPAEPPLASVTWYARSSAQGAWQRVADGIPREGRLILENTRMHFAEHRLEFNGPRPVASPRVLAEKAQAYLLYQSSSFSSLRMYYGGKPKAGEPALAAWTSAANATNGTVLVSMQVRRPAFDGELTQRLKRPIVLGLTLLGASGLFLVALAVQFRRNTR